MNDPAGRFAYVLAHPAMLGLMGGSKERWKAAQWRKRYERRYRTAPPSGRVGTVLGVKIKK